MEAKRDPINRWLRIGDQVTCKDAVVAWYSGYAGNPKCTFEPGKVGTIVDINIPTVKGPYLYFHKVEFDGPPQADKFKTTKWICSLHSDNVIIVGQKAVAAK